MHKLTTRRCKPQGLAWVSTPFGLQFILVARELGRLTCCTPTTANIDSVVILPSTDDIVREASAGSVRDSVVEVRTNHTGAALNHVSRSVHSLAVQRRRVVEEGSLIVFVTVAVIRACELSAVPKDYGTSLTSIARNHCSQPHFVCLYT